MIMSFFSRRHFIWFVNMAHCLNLDDDQIGILKSMLSTTNTRFNGTIFDEAILKRWMKN
jgi:hypothetical protein